MLTLKSFGVELWRPILRLRQLHLFRKNHDLHPLSGRSITSLSRFRTKTLFLDLPLVVCVIGTAVRALAYDDRIDSHVGALRTRLADEGITFNLQYAAEVWSNVAGGESTGTVYTGLMSLQGNIDLQKLFGWQGASISTRWYWLSGQDISATNLGNNIFTVSNIAGFPTLRMNEIWFQQNIMNNRISIRLGQLAADSEFGLSSFDTVFLNGTFGWSPDLYTNIPNGGPGYPMAVPGVRLALTPLSWLTYQGAVFQGNVFAQNVNQHGFRWDLNPSNGYFSIHELSFRTYQGAEDNGLPGEFKIAAGSTQRPTQMLGARNLGTTACISSQTRCFTEFLSLLLHF